MQQLKQKTDRPDNGTKLPISMRVANTMHKLGVVGLPRNYEVFYFAMTGTNAELQSELWEIGNGLKQEDLDLLHVKHCARADDERMITRICNTVESRLGEAIQLIRTEKSSVRNYGHVLDQASQRLTPGAPLPPESMKKLLRVLSKATESTQQQGAKTIASMENNSNQLQSISQELEEYKRLAETDCLTGLLNRRGFDARMSELCSDGLKNMALAIGDIDKFKAFNDTYGHPFGDMVIKTVAKIIKANAREDLSIARVGGEEFAVFCNNIEEEGMMRLTERLRVAIAETVFTDGRTRLSPGNVTVSFGVSHAVHATNFEDLYSNSDEALYSSKRVGRNRVTSFADIRQSPDRKNLLLYKDK